jgi:hypothetical protein
MGKTLKQKLIRKLQKICWIYLTKNFIISSTMDFRKDEADIKYKLIPINFDNYNRVGDFREKNRISEYRDKLTHGEIGFFAEHSGNMVGSIWASINKAEVPIVVRTYMKLMPDEGLIHDIVAGETSRRIGVGVFMVRRIGSILLKKYRLSRVTIDVNIRNRPSLGLMKKLGLQIDCTMLYVSAFGKALFQIRLKNYT